MIQLKDLSLVGKRRTLRTFFGPTQGYPYPVNLDPSFNRTSGGQLGLGSPVGQAAIFPGAVMNKLAGEVVTLSTDASNAASATTRFGLEANFVGGNLDDLHGAAQTSVWRGRGSTYLLLAPVFAFTVSAFSSAGAAFLTWNATGQISDKDNTAAAAVAANAVARLIDNLGGSANSVIIDLLLP